MFNFLLFAALFVLSVSAYTFSYTSSGIVNAFTAFDFTYAQNAVVSDPNGGPAYFSKRLFYRIVDDYFTVNLEKYSVDDWNVSLDFKDGDGKRTEYVSRVDMCFTCKFNNGRYAYNAYKAFEIREGKAI